MQITNKTFQNINPEDLKTFDDLSIFIENMSSAYLDIWIHHFEAQRKCEDGIWAGSFEEIHTIAKKIGCNEKTVDRFNRDMRAIVQKRNRFKNGKQTSNVYSMSKVVYQYMKAFWRLGLFKDNGLSFEAKWQWIKKIWVECCGNHLAFMNRIWNRKPPKNSSLKGGHEQGDKKMSLGDLEKCPSTLNSLSDFMNICTSFVPSKEMGKILERLGKLLKDTIIDMKWFAVEKNNTINHFTGLLFALLRKRLEKLKPG